MSIKKNSIHTIGITEITSEGQGIGSLEGLPVLVDRAIPGEVIEVKIIKVTPKYAVGKLLNPVKPAKERVTPFCPVFRRCGGCSLQHIEYQAQLRLKTARVLEEFQHRAGLERVNIHETLGMAHPFAYRNKAQYPVGKNANDELVMGFYAKRSHEIIEHPVCEIQPDIMEKIRACARAFLVEFSISIYDETRHTGLVRQIIIRLGRRTGEIMVVVVINGHDLPKKQTLIHRLLSEISGIQSIVLNINQKDTNVILGKENRTIYGEDTITDILGECSFGISPSSFYQINPIQTEILYTKALEYAGLTGTETVFDLYCGIGTIALFLAHKAKKVYGIERGEEAVRDAKRNAIRNGMNNVEFLSGDAGQVFSEMAKQGITADVVVVDPPRKGCDERLLNTIITMQPQRVIYVSCHPATLARDAEYLAQHGFQTVEVQPVDMFPHTTHVEAVVLLQRKNWLKK